MLTDFRLELLGKYLCFAIVAVGIGLAWGRGGMLTLGQGVFFGLGGYIMAMHLKLADAGPGGGVPDFMKLYGTGEVPSWWDSVPQPGFRAAVHRRRAGLAGPAAGPGDLQAQGPRCLLRHPVPGAGRGVRASC